MRKPRKAGRTGDNFRRVKRTMKAAKKSMEKDWDKMMKDDGTYDDGGYDANDLGVGRKRQSRSKFYLDDENSRFLGVCAGIADYTGIDVTWVRVAFIAMFFLGVPFVVIGYFVAAFIADDKPDKFREEEPAEQEFWRNVRTKPHTTLRDVTLRFKDMERRLRDMEKYVTSNSRRLDQEINALRD